MTHALHDYLAGQLGEWLTKRSIVVFYDPREEFRPFFDDLGGAESTGQSPIRVTLAEAEVNLALYSGSYFELRATVEPIAGRTAPEMLLVYLPGEARDREASVLMELELAGHCYEPQLKRLARHLLQRSFSDAQIDELLNRDGVTYQDIVAFLSQAPTDGPASVLRAIF
ncbi:MAG: PglZ domain-containing protein, partial [Actinomycetes bacterium]